MKTDSCCHQRAMKELVEALMADADGKSIDHYGREHLESVLGAGGLSAALRGNNDWCYIPHVSEPGLTHLLAGYKSTASGRELSTLLLLGPSQRQLTPLTTPENLMSAELIRVRSGLMREGTAQRLAVWLSRRPRRPVLGEALTWEVLEGPSATETVRNWLDKWSAAERMLLQEQTLLQPPTELRRIPLVAMRLVKGVRLAQSQSMTYGPRVVTMPARYCVSGVASGGFDGLPPEYEVWARRQEDDPVAASVGGILQMCGVVPRESKGWSADRQVNPAVDAAGELWPHLGCTTSGTTIVPPTDRSRSFKATELGGVLRALRRKGLRRLQIHDCRVAQIPFRDDGRDRYDSVVATVSPHDGQPYQLKVALESSIELPLQLPESEWPRWALETSEMIEEKAAEDEAQCWASEHAAMVPWNDETEDCRKTGNEGTPP